MSDARDDDLRRVLRDFALDSEMPRTLLSVDRVIDAITAHPDVVLRALGGEHSVDIDGECYGASQIGECIWTVPNVPCPLADAPASGAVPVRHGHTIGHTENVQTNLL